MGSSRTTCAALGSIYTLFGFFTRHQIACRPSPCDSHLRLGVGVLGSGAQRPHTSVMMQQMAGYGAQPAPRLAPGTRAPLLLPARRCRPALLRPNRPAAPQLPGLAAAARGGRGDGSGGADRRAATTPPARPSQAAAPPSADASGWRTFWAAVDASAWLGTVGTAAAFLITQEAMLAAAPVVLPLLALYASRQRERLATEAEGARQLARLEALLLDLQADTADEVAAEVGAGAAAVGPTGAGAGKGHSCRAAPASLSINMSPAPLPGGRRG